MKWTMPRLRLAVWKILIHPNTTIDYKKVGNASAVGYSSPGEKGVEIYIDHYKTDVRYATLHEILHSIFDQNFETFSTYNIYEFWITSLEQPFFKTMSTKDKDKWRKAVERKLKKSQLLKTLKE